ncbi:MAG: acetyl-CoA hydrolase/transferase family protein [Chloroflexi bacterium]|nr:acetyl-CoA hydrolase/transferase family protein [Chloroflexota bacterium]
MDWREDYQRKFITAEQAARFVRSGDRVVFPGGREAFALGHALAARRAQLKDVELLVTAPTYDFGWYKPGWQDSFRITVMQASATAQPGIDGRLIDFNTGTLIPFREVDGARSPDVVFVEVSEPDDNGFCSFGASLWDKKRRVRQAKLAVAEVNKNLIRTFGDNFIHVSEIAYFVDHVSSGGAPGQGSLAGRKIKEPEPYVKRIAENVSQLIRDGDTIQIGVGRTTEPLVRQGLLNGKSDLGYHSEATPSGIISLVRDGVINGKRKTLNPGKAVVAALGGSTREEMEWANNNPLFHVVEVDYLEDIRVIAAHDNMVAINQALMIDLTGQIAAETLGHRLMAVAGGQIVFVFGAWLSRGGRSITVIPSTAQGGKVSRIVPTLPQGTVVTVQRNMADYVVTEYGIARLKGKTLRQRTQELIAVAHPDFRSELEQEARRLYWPG